MAGLAHDLNNVFETLSEVAELLGRDPNWIKLAATIQRSVARGERIVESLSETARQSGELDVILDNAIQHADDFLRVTRSAAVTWQRDLAPGLSLPGSSASWERVFVNLFLNAAQVKPEETAIAIRAERKPQGVVVTVADNGPGIPADVLPYLFEARFSTKRGRRRSGLGLHIVSSIVGGNGGTVTAENREPRGALFTITVPLEG